MARLMEGMGLQALPQRAAWAFLRHARAARQRFGWFGGLICACVLVAIVAIVLRHHQLAQVREMTVSAQQPVQAVVAAPEIDASAMALKTGLAQFEANLVDYEDSSFVLQDLLDQAKALGLSLPRGEYQSSIDQAGGFLRYRMTLPAKGQGDALPKFIVGALQAHPSLALEGVQFKRVSGVSQDIDARLQFVLMTRLPKRLTTPTRGAGQ